MTVSAENITQARTDAGSIKLTHLASCAGCAAKLPQSLLADVLRHLPLSAAEVRDGNVLVDASTFDDAAVYRISDELALVQTVDFFTPIVDDPYDFGQIAAANAISDIYAMGGRPVTALNLLGVPTDKLEPQVIAAIVRGGADKAREANCALVGGHTIRSAEPIYGLSVTGLVHPQKMMSNAAARPDDLLVLTKPLGTGVVTTAIKRGLASPAVIEKAIDGMKRLNAAGVDLAERSLVRCATDVTGFGLTGHLGNIVRASGVAAEIRHADVPAISADVLALIADGCVPGGTKTNLEFADGLVQWGTTPGATRILLADAQTSGPLLLCVPPAKLNEVREVLAAHATTAAAVIGRIVAGRPAIYVR